MRRIAIAFLSVLAVSCGAATGPAVGDVSAAAATLPATPRPSQVIITSTASVLSMAGKVTMGDNFFAPDEITVAVGATVTWEIVAGDAKHDVVASDGSFRSNSPMNRGDLFTYTFTKAGGYSYICSYHTVEHMVGKIVVK
jgi:plastocyanin